MTDALEKYHIIIEILLYILAGVGASGAICGIFGVYLLDMICNWNKLMKVWVAVLIDVIIFVALLIVGIFIPSIDHMAHFGGLLVGVLSGLLLCPNLYWKIGKFNDPLKLRLVIMGLSLVFLLIIFLGGFIGFFKTPAMVIYFKI